MAQKDAIDLIKKAAADDKFRHSLHGDFDKTVASEKINLTKEEHDSLKKVNWNETLSTGAESHTWVHIYKMAQ